MLNEKEVPVSICGFQLHSGLWAPCVSHSVSVFPGLLAASPQDANLNVEETGVPQVIKAGEGCMDCIL